VFGPLVHATDPSRFYALDPEAACCFAYHGEPFVLAIGTVGFRDQGSTGKRHGLLMHGSAVAVLRQCVLSRRHLVPGLVRPPCSCSSGSTRTPGVARARARKPPTRNVILGRVFSCISAGRH
jgi:hypothetical protein